jgi:hypothetical protein
MCEIKCMGTFCSVFRDPLCVRVYCTWQKDMKYGQCVILYIDVTWLITLEGDMATKSIVCVKEFMKESS